MVSVGLITGEVSIASVELRGSLAGVRDDAIWRWGYQSVGCQDEFSSDDAERLMCDNGGLSAVHVDSGAELRMR